MRILYVCFLCLYYSIQAIEYIYPVASYNDEIIFIQQTSPQDIQLFQWNSITNHIELLLCSLFKPALVELLPDNKGFSFIDNGRLRLKLFEKRSPKSIDFEYPIININGLHWLDEYTCYCSAQYNDYFSLFQLHTDGRVDWLSSNDNEDYMYPQKVNEQLFYISRKKENNSEYDYKIMHSLYGKNTTAEIINNFSHKPIIFLHMISEAEGFVVEHQNYAQESLFYFFYHHFIKEESGWKNICLFSFAIPTYLFLEHNDQRLFESIVPLLPRIIDNKIYFSDYSQAKNALELYYYDLSTNQHNKISIKKNIGHIFAPIMNGMHIYSGGTKNNKNNSNDDNKCPFFSIF